MNEENKTTMLCQIISQIIKESHMTCADADEIRKVLDEKVQDSKKDGEQCLADVVEKEITKLVDEGTKVGKMSKSSIKLYQPVIDQCFRGTEIANKPVTELSEAEIRKLIIQASEICGMDKTDMICFMGLLQAGLNKLAEDNILNFNPDKHLYKNYLEADRGIKYINNPYGEEKEKIMRWIDRNPGDIRGLAVRLWFTGDISAVQITSLKKENWNKCIPEKGERAKIISEALKLHPENGEYVFMARKRGRWEKLMARSLQTKLYYICEDLGIEYIKIHRDEAFICKE